MKKNLLLAVDDKPDNLYVLQSLIAQHLPDCEIRTVPSAKEGLAAAAESDFDGVLIDVQMPGMSGIEMCRRLKSDERTAHVPVILITAHHTDPKLKAEGLQVGADDFLTKPVDNIELVAKIKVMLRIKHTEDRLRDMNADLDQLVAERTQALRESEERLSQIAETVEDVFWITDFKNHKTLFASRAYEKIWGRSLQDLYTGARSWADAIHPEERERAWENFVKLGEGSSYDEEYRIVRPDGSMRWIRDQGFPVRDVSGQVYRVAGIAQDITERKRAQEELRQYKHIVSSATDMLALLDKNFVYLAANAAYLRAFAKVSDEVIGRTVADVFGQELFNMIIKPMAERCLAGEDIRYQKWFDFPAVGQKYMDVAYSPYLGPDMEAQGFVVAARDITEHKRAEEELVEYREHLEERVRNRTEELRSVVMSMAGRENRMIELKETVKKLRAQLEEAGMTPVADDPLKEGRSGKGEEL